MIKIDLAIRPQIDARNRFRSRGRRDALNREFSNNAAFYFAFPFFFSTGYFFNLISDLRARAHGNRLKTVVKASSNRVNDPIKANVSFSDTSDGNPLLCVEHARVGSASHVVSLHHRDKLREIRR